MSFAYSVELFVFTARRVDDALKHAGLICDAAAGRLIGLLGTCRRTDCVHIQKKK